MINKGEMETNIYQAPIIYQALHTHSFMYIVENTYILAVVISIFEKMKTKNNLPEIIKQVNIRIRI